MRKLLCSAIGLWALGASACFGQADTVTSRDTLGRTVPSMVPNCRTGVGTEVAPCSAAAPLTVGVSGRTPTRTAVTVAASSVQLRPASATRTALQIACDGTSTVAISQTGATLTTNTLAGGADTIIPATASNTYTAPFATQSAITAYGTSTSQTCVILEW